MQPEQDLQWQQPDQVPEHDVAEADAVYEPMSWEASEYVQHDKNGIWFLALAGVASALLLLDYFLIKSLTFALLIIVMAIGVVVVARRPPRVLRYTLTASTLQIDSKALNLADFQAFGVLQEEAMYSIRLIPKKRFMPAVNVFFPPEYGEGIVDMFGSVLPMEHVEHDLIDTLAQKIRF